MSSHVPARGMVVAPITGYAELARDTVAWAAGLPREFDTVAGIPRSGLMPAVILSLHLNVPIASLDTLAAGSVMPSGRRLAVPEMPRRVLVVDDCAATGAAMQEARDVLAARKGLDVKYGAVYCQEGAEGFLDYHYQLRPVCYLFEWNLMHLSRAMGQACVAIDGVLCESLSESPSARSGKERILAATPLIVPGATVRCLLAPWPEQFRATTIEWLTANKVEYGELVMAPDGMEPGSAAATRFKARAYAASQCAILIESTLTEAKTIHALTGKPVYGADRKSFCLGGAQDGEPLARLERSLFER